MCVVTFIKNVSTMKYFKASIFKSGVINYQIYKMMNTVMPDELIMKNCD